MRGLKPDPNKNEGVFVVASFTDAWIETSEVIQRLYVFLSHLLQMRGLKPQGTQRNFKK